MARVPARKSFFSLLRRRHELLGDVDEELRLHIELTAEQLVAEGMSPAAAHQESLRRFGDLDRRRTECTEIDWSQLRSERRSEWMAEFFQDLRYAGRVLLKNRAFASVVLLTLALGIGANVALFSVVQGVVLRPLPYREPGQLAMIWTQFTGYDLAKNWVSEPELLEMREGVKSFEGIGAVYSHSGNLTGEGEPERVLVGVATPELFPILGVAPVLGRVFTPEEGAPAAQEAVLLTDALWRRRFAADPSILGRTLSLNGRTRTIIGVLPPDFDLEIQPGIELWAPMVIDPANLGDRGNHGLLTIARLRPGATLAQAQGELAALAARRIEDGRYKPEWGWGMNPVSMHEEVVGDVRAPLLVLLGAVGFVLLIACANVANLLLARTNARGHEMAIRRAVGAGSGRLLRQMLTESVLLSTVGGAAGVAVAWGALRFLRVAGPPLPRLGTVGLDVGLLAFALGLSVLTGLLFGMAPALQARRSDLVETLKDRAAAGARRPSRQRLQSILVVAEVSLAVVLLAGAGLLLRSFWRIHDVTPGFRTEGVLTFQLSLPKAQYAEMSDINSFFDGLLERLGAVPGVESAAAIQLLPMANDSYSGTMTANRPGHPEEPRIELETDYRWVRGPYFQTLGLRLIEGRVLGPEDRMGAAQAVVVDDTMAHRMWPGESALGKRLALGGGGPLKDEAWYTVVGVVGHVKQTALQVQGREQAYIAAEQVPFPERTMHVALRTTGPSQSLLAGVRSTIRSIDPSLPISDVRTMDERVRESMATPRFHLMLLGLFAVVAVLLAAVGIYGVLSYMVHQRTRELGIRMALGARRFDVLRLVLGQGMLRAALGMGLGLCGALALSPVLASQLFEVAPSDPLTFVGISLLLGAVALGATLLPAFRATRVAPLTALRQE